MIVKKILKKLPAIAIWLCVWQLVSLIVKNEILMPGIPQVFNTLVRLAGTSGFWVNILLSLLRISAGFVIGVITGICLASLCSKFHMIESLFAPLISVIRTTPVASFIILALVWLNKAWVPVFIVVLIVMPVIYQNITDGINDIPKVLIESARVYRLDFFKKMKYVYIQSLKNSLRAAFVTAFGLAWKSGIAAEVLAVPVSSIGYNIYRSKINIETDALFAWTFVVIILSGLFEVIIKRLLGVKKNDKN